MKGTIDRIEDNNLAVILIEDANESNNEKNQLVVEKSKIPEEFNDAGAVLKFRMDEDNNPKDFQHLKKEEESRRERIRRKFDRLSSRPSDSNDSEQ